MSEARGDAMDDAPERTPEEARPAAGAGPDAVRVRVQALVRGVELPPVGVAWIDGGSATLDGPTLAIAQPADGWRHPLASDVEAPGRMTFGVQMRVELAGIDGVVLGDGGTRGGGVLALHLPGDDVVELVPATDAEAAPFAALAARAVALAYAFPEVTRALRAFGSRRGAPGSDHDRFFAPLVAPLRAARDVVASATAEPWRAVERVDAAKVARELEEALGALAAAHAEAAPDRRALEAELLELAEPLLDAVRALGDAGEAVRAAAADRRLVAWRAWAAALADAFARADRCWIAALPALADARGSQGRFWRRVLRREAP